MRRVIFASACEACDWVEFGEGRVVDDEYDGTGAPYRLWRWERGRLDQDLRRYVARLPDGPTTAAHWARLAHLAEQVEIAEQREAAVRRIVGLPARRQTQVEAAFRAFAERFEESPRPFGSAVTSRSGSVQVTLQCSRDAGYDSRREAGDSPSA